MLQIENGNSEHFFIVLQLYSASHKQNQMKNRDWVWTRVDWQSWKGNGKCLMKCIFLMENDNRKEEYHGLEASADRKLIQSHIWEYKEVKAGK